MQARERETERGGKAQPATPNPPPPPNPHHIVRILKKMKADSNERREEKQG